MFNLLRIDNGPTSLPFDQWEAAEAVGRLLFRNVTESERDGNGFVVTLETCLGSTVHHLAAPSCQGMFNYREQISRVTPVGRGTSQIRYRPQAAVDLYNSIAGTTEGYAEGVAVPAHHKFTVAIAVANLHDELSAPSDPNS